MPQALHLEVLKGKLVIPVKYVFFWGRLLEHDIQGIYFGDVYVSVCIYSARYKNKLYKHIGCKSTYAVGLALCINLSEDKHDLWL